MMIEINLLPVTCYLLPVICLLFRAFIYQCCVMKKGRLNSSYQSILTIIDVMFELLILLLSFILCRREFERWEMLFI